MWPRSWSGLRSWAAVWLGLMALAANPSHANVTVLGSLEREWPVQAGDQLHSAIEVHNPGSSPVRVRAYLKDFDPRPDGLGYQAPPTHHRSNAAWIALMPSEQVIEAGARAVFNVTISVPPVLAQEGSWWSVVMIEGSDDGGNILATAEDPTLPSMGIRHVMRTAVRLVTTAGGPFSLAFVERSLITGASAHNPAISLVLGNDGHRNLHLTLHADLFDAQGQPVGRIAPHQPITRLLPGAQAKRILPLPELPEGDYQAVVIADHRGAQLFGARYSFHLPNTQSAQVVP